MHVFLYRTKILMYQINKHYLEASAAEKALNVFVNIKLSSLRVIGH